MQRGILIAAALVILGYGLFEARKLLDGPNIVIFSPVNGSATSTGMVTVVGKAENISFLTINDSPSYTNEEGKFVYRYSPPAGYTTLTVGAVDRFGRRAQKSISFTVVNYCALDNYT